MRTVSRSKSSWKFVPTGVALLSCFLIFSTQADAQLPGNNAVYSSSGTCTSSSCGFSAAFVDASVLTASAPNICGILHSILNGVSPGAPLLALSARGGCSCGIRL
jgi:hypothetical protein